MSTYNISTNVTQQATRHQSAFYPWCDDHSKDCSYYIAGNVSRLNYTAFAHKENMPQRVQYLTFARWMTLSTFPLQFVIGLLGNALVLRVLLSRSMHTRTNVLLAMVSLCDILFLFSMVPIQVDVCKFWSRETQAYYKKYVEMHAMALSNWFSVASAWFVVIISAERLFAIVRPLYVRELWQSRRRFYCLIGAVFAGAFALTFYCNVSQTWTIHCLQWDERGECVVVPIGLKPAQRHARFKTYVQWSIWIQTVLHIVLPLVLVATIDIALMIGLHRQQNRAREMLGDKNKRQSSTAGRSKTSTSKRGKSIRLANGNGNPKTAKLSPPDNSTALKSALIARSPTANSPVSELTSFNNSMNSSGSTFRLDEAERRALLTVVCIVTAFIVYYTPSAVIAIGGITDYRARFISNTLVVTGKVLNFFLLCCSSVHFRKKCHTVLTRRRHSSMRSKSTFMLREKP